MRMPDYVKVGDGPITVFLLHGGYGSKDYWAHEIPILVDQGYRVVAWDAPGYGLSPIPDHYSIELVAETAAHLITQLGSERNVIFGHSMGGIIGPKAIQLIPDRVQALVISASLAELAQGGEEFARDFIEKRVPPLRKVRTLAEAAMPLLKSMFAPGSSGPAVDLVLDIAGKTPSETFIQAMLAIQQYQGVPVVSQLKLPVLCVGGRHDPVALPELMAKTAALIPGAELEIFEDAGHYPFAECPDAFNGVLFNFLARHGLKP